MRSVWRFTRIISGSSPVRAAAPVHEQHVIFENSAADDAHFHSEGSFIAPSSLDLTRAKFPVSSEKFVSPPNGLRLKWKSASGGDWRMTLNRPSRIGAELEMQGDTLYLWCYSDEEITRRRSRRC